jgi:hypothetical protein
MLQRLLSSPNRRDGCLWPLALGFLRKGKIYIKILFVSLLPSCSFTLRHRVVDSLCHAGERGPKRDLTETEFIKVQNGITEIL